MKDQKAKRDELLHVATQLAAGLLFCSLVDMDEELLSEVAVLQAKSLIKKGMVANYGPGDTVTSFYSMVGELMNCPVNHYGDCKYFNEKGQSCIVGHMMPEDVKRNTFDVDVEELEWAQELFSDKQIGVLMDLQYEHDRTVFSRAIDNMRRIESGL